MAGGRLTFSIPVFFVSIFFLLNSVGLAIPLWSYPSPQSAFVNDFASVLTPEDAEEIKQALFNFKQKKQIPVVVVTVQTLNGEPVENFARGLGNQWEIGLGGKSNGVLLLFAQWDRKVTLQFGSRTALPRDAQNRIIANMVQYFKNGAVSAGLKEGTRQLLEQLGGGGRIATPQRTTAPHRNPSRSHQDSGSSGLIGLVGLVALAIPMIIGFMIFSFIFKMFTGGFSSRRGQGYSGGGSGWGGVFGGGVIGYLLGSFFNSRSHAGDDYYHDHSSSGTDYSSSDSGGFFSSGSSDSGSSWDTSSNSSSADSGGSDWGGGSMDGGGSSGEW